METEKAKLTKKRLLEDIDVNDRTKSWQEIPLDQKIACQRTFVENLQEIEDMEIKIEKLRRENDAYKKRWPDLAPFEGLMEKWFKKKMFPIHTTDGTLRVFGPTQEKALEDHRAKIQKDEKNKEKVQTKSKKSKMDTN